MNHRPRDESTFNRTASLFRKRPSVAISTNQLTVRKRRGQPDEIEGMGCKIVGTSIQFEDDGAARLRPALLGLSALGLCLAGGYMLRFESAEIDVDGVEVFLQATIDKRRAYSVSDDAPAGYQDLRYSVQIDSEADEDKILRVVEEADRCSPWLDNFTQSRPATRDVTVKCKEPAE